MAIHSKIIRILRHIKNWIRNRYDGKRTKIAGFGLVFLGIAYGLPIVEPRVLGYLPPEVIKHLPEPNMVLSYLCFLAAIYIWGQGGKLEKIKDSIESSKSMF